MLAVIGGWKCYNVTQRKVRELLEIEISRWIPLIFGELIILNIKSKAFRTVTSMISFIDVIHSIGKNHARLFKQ